MTVVDRRHDRAGAVPGFLARDRAKGTVRLLTPFPARRRPEVPSPLLFPAVPGGLLNWGFSGMFQGAAAVAVIWSLGADWIRARAPDTA